MDFKNTLLAFQEDIEDRGLMDWLKANTAFLRPLHRYRGTLKLLGGELHFEGEDVKGVGLLDLRIPY